MGKYIRKSFGVSARSQWKWKDRPLRELLVKVQRELEDGLMVSIDNALKIAFMFT